MITASGPWMKQIRRILQVSYLNKSQCQNVELFITEIPLKQFGFKRLHSHSYKVHRVCVCRSGGGFPVPWGKSSPQRLPGLQCLYLCLWTNW